jgi:hypothetical protein
MDRNLGGEKMRYLDVIEDERSEKGFLNYLDSCWVEGFMRKIRQLLVWVRS